MNLTLYVNVSEKNKIRKNITAGETLSGTLRGESNVVSPVITINHANPTGFNYAYIPDFKRYYFITEMTAVRTGIWSLKFASDPLMSFSEEILNCSAILNETTKTGESRYLPGRNWITSCKTKTDIVSFSNGLLNDGQFILITAGG